MKTNKKGFEKLELIILITCSAFITSFVLAVWIVSGPSLGYYTTLHALLAGISITTLLLKPKSKVIIRLVTALALIGALSAVWLTAIYLPWYLDYVN